MEATLKIEQDLSFTEYFRSALYYFNNKRFKIFLIILYLAPLLPEVIFLIMIPNFQFHYDTLYLSFVPIVIVFIVAIIIVFFGCCYFYYVKSQYFHNISYSFTHWGIVRDSETSGFSKPWREIVKCKETRSFFLVYTTPRDFQVIQKRKFETPEDVIIFRDLLNENITHK